MDAAYEGVQKRTFLVMLLSAVLYVLILVGILLLYPKLVTPTPNEPDDQEFDTEQESSGILKHTDSLSDSD